MNQALKAFSALAHESRLVLFRLVVEAGPKGLTAGALSQRASISPSSLSFHAASLEQAGLVASRREGRNVIYAPVLDTVVELQDFLTWNCCNGHPDLCRSVPAENDVGPAISPAKGVAQ